MRLVGGIEVAPERVFRLVDDDGDMGALKDRLVRTDFDIGLTEAHADRVLEMFGVAVTQ